MDCLNNGSPICLNTAHPKNHNRVASLRAFVVANYHRTPIIEFIKDLRAQDTSARGGRQRRHAICLGQKTMTQFQGKFRLERAHLQQLFDALTLRGYQIVGPTVRDRAIVYEQLNSVTDLPMGWADEQDGG